MLFAPAVSADTTPHATAVCPPVVQLGSAATFSSSGSVPSDTHAITGYNWSFGDGSGSTDANPSHTYGLPGTYSVSLTVSDDTPQTSSAATCSVRVNPPPQINIQNSFAVSSPLPGQATQTPEVGQSLAISGANATDTTNGSTDDKSGLKFAWAIDNPAQVNTNKDWVSAPLTQPGLHTLAVTVTDPDGGTTTASATFRVDDPPVSNFVYFPLTPITSDTVTFAATSDDTDLRRNLGNLGESLSYAWDLNNDGKFDDASGPVVAWQFPTAGTYKIALKTTDAAGISNVKQLSVTVQTTRPNAKFSWAPTPPLPGQDVTFTSNSTPSSPDKTITSTEWDFNFDGFNFNPQATGASVTHSFAEPGPHKVAMRVIEHKDGTTDGVSIVFDTVNVNAPPSAVFAFNPAEPFVGDEVTLSSASFDPDGPLAKQEWDLNGDGKFDDASAAVVTARFGIPGTYTVGLRVTDVNGATSTVTHAITVKARPAQITRLQMVPGVAVSMGGSLRGTKTVVKRLFVSAPAGATVGVRCRRPVKSKSKSKSKKQRMAGCGIRVKPIHANGKRIRVRQMERAFAAGTQITVTVSQPGFIASVTSFTMRARHQPLRQRFCIPPGVRAAIKCVAT